MGSKAKARRLFERGGGVCYFHGGGLIPAAGGTKPAHRRFHIATRDHLLPRHAGGDDSDENTVLACEACNQMKGGLPAEAFIILCNMVAQRHPRET